MIYLHTLGNALISIGAKEIRPTSPLLFATLLYLGMERGRRVPRAALQELLFPDVGERSGAHSLRQLLYKLRQLGTAVTGDGSGTLLRPDDVSVDVADVAELAHRQPDRLAQGFLPGYLPTFSEPFGEWLDRKRSAVEAEIRRALVSRLTQYRDSAQWPHVERIAQLILGVDPYNEEATLALAEATAMAGSKAEALRILDRFEHEAGSQDLRLPAAVLRRRISERIPSSLMSARPPFVGRATEVQALLEQIRHGLAGAGGVLVITGEPGIGKTRLLEETLAVAMLDGVAVYTARCKAHDVARPMSVFIELAPTLLQARGALGVSPDSLAHLTLLTRHSDDRVDRPVDARDDVTRSRIVIGAFRDLVDAVFAEQRFLLVVEDVHWCDADSLRELASMSASLSKPLVILLTARSLAAEARELLLSHEAVLHKVPPLGDEAVTELARTLVPAFRQAASDDPTLQWYVRRAGGNPLFLRMLCADFAEDRPFHVPSDLLALATSRIERLSSSSRRVLEFSALLGRRATKQALRELTQYTAMELLDAVQPLEEEGCLQLNGNSYVAHDLVGECALQRLRPATMTLLHDCVASYLEALYTSTHDAAVLWDCADHWVAGGDNSKAIRFLKRCAQHSVDIGHASHALALLERAYGLANNAAEKAAISAAIMVAARAGDQWVVVWDASRRLAEAKAGEPLDHTVEELLSLEAEFERTFAVSAICTKLSMCVHAAEASTNHRVQAATSLFRMAFESGLRDLAHDAYSIIEPFLESHSDNFEHRIAGLIYHTSFGNRDRAVDIARHLRRDLEKETSVSGYFRIGSNTAIAMSFLGITQESIDMLRSLHDKAKRLELTDWQFEFAADICWTHLEREELDNAKSWYQTCTELADKVRMTPKILTRHIAAECEIALLDDNNEQAMSAYARFLAVVPAESLRARVYLSTYPTRLRLRDPTYVCHKDEIADLHRAHAIACQFSGFDFTALTLAEALCRANNTDEARDVISEHLSRNHSRRSTLGPSLAAVARRLNISYLNGKDGFLGAFTTTQEHVT